MALPRSCPRILGPMARIFVGEAIFEILGFVTTQDSQDGLAHEDSGLAREDSGLAHEGHYGLSMAERFRL